MYKTNQYGKVALAAYKILVEEKLKCSRKAWKIALDKQDVSDKDCPSSAFVALTEL